MAGLDEPKGVVVQLREEPWRGGDHPFSLRLALTGKAQKRSSGHRGVLGWHENLDRRRRGYLTGLAHIRRGVQWIPFLGIRLVAHELWHCVYRVGTSHHHPWWHFCIRSGYFSRFWWGHVPRRLKRAARRLRRYGSVVVRFHG